MSDDLSNDPDFRQYAEDVLRNMVPSLYDSEFAISIVPTGRGKNEFDQGDVKYWVELGASIMFDKPIIALVAPGADLPERLRRVADIILEVDMSTEAGRQKGAEQIAVAIAKLEEAKHG